MVSATLARVALCLTAVHSVVGQGLMQPTPGMTDPQQIPVPAAGSQFINCGAAAITTADIIGDDNFENGMAMTNVGDQASDITGTVITTGEVPPEVFLSERADEEGDGFEYIFPLPGKSLAELESLPSENAIYKITFYFVEQHFTRPNARLFDILVDREPFVLDFDIYEESGRQNNEVVVKEFIKYDTSQLREIVVTFKSVIDTAKVNGIKIEYLDLLDNINAIPPSIFINCGGPPTLVTTLRTFFDADRFFNGGAIATSSSTDDIKGTTFDEVHRTERNDDSDGEGFYYTLPTPTRGTYGLAMRFSEKHWTQAGGRLFNVYVNEISILQDFDVYAEAGGQNTEVFVSQVLPGITTPNITVRFESVSDVAFVNAIELSYGEFQ